MQMIIILFLKDIYMRTSNYDLNLMYMNTP